MKSIAATLLAVTLLAGAAEARPVDGYFTNLGQTAPRSVFDDLRDTAPRSVFDDLKDSAPRSAGDASTPLDLTGE